MKTKFLMHYPSVVAARKASGSLYNQLLQQARLASFFDAFTVLALLAVAVIPLLLLIKYKKPKPEKPAS